MAHDRLWGNPGHLWYIEAALRDKYVTDKLHILVPKSNSGNFTYDGIELGAERVTHDIETFLETQKREGKKITKLSIVGYSLGGLVARYAIGLLFSRGWFSDLEPINFTTFATPHLGVRVPGSGVGGRFFNLFGSRTLSTSGRQLFLIDTFRDTNRPLLSVLADPGSIFMQALSKFKHRVLYSNILNDRSAPYYTTSITSTNPFTNLEDYNVNYLDGYSPNILDSDSPFSPKESSVIEPLYNRLASNSRAIINGLPFAALLSIALPVATVALLINSGIQSVRSTQRIRLHEAGKAGIRLGSYRIPLMVEDARSVVEGALISMTNAPPPQQYSSSSINPTNSKNPEKTAGSAAPSSPSTSATSATTTTDVSLNPSTGNFLESGFPPLALTESQFIMIANLNDVGFRKHLVHIHKVNHSHAAIILRKSARRYEEGKVVIGHWLEEEFEI